MRRLTAIVTAGTSTIRAVVVAVRATAAAAKGVATEATVAARTSSAERTSEGHAIVTYAGILVLVRLGLAALATNFLDVREQLDELFRAVTDCGTAKLSTGNEMGLEKMDMPLIPWSLPLSSM